MNYKEYEVYYTKKGWDFGQRTVVKATNIDEVSIMFYRVKDDPEREVYEIKSIYPKIKKEEPKPKGKWIEL